MKFKDVLIIIGKLLETLILIPIALLLILFTYPLYWLLKWLTEDDIKEEI